MFLSKSSTEERPPVPASTRWKFFVIGGLLVVFVMTGSAVAGAVYYDDKVLPNTSVAGIPLGGARASEVETTLRRLHDRLQTERGSVLIVGAGKQEEVVFGAREEGQPFVTFNPKEEAARAVSYSKEQSLGQKVLTFLHTLTTSRTLPLSSVAVNTSQFDQAVEENLGRFDGEYKDASFRITSLNPFRYEVLPGTPGTYFDKKKAEREIVESYRFGRTPHIRMVGVTKEPTLQTSDIETALQTISPVLKSSIEFTFHTTASAPTTTIVATPGMLASWLEARENPQNEPKVIFGVQEEKAGDYIRMAISSVVDQEPTQGLLERDSDGRVTKFVPAVFGQQVDVATTIALLEEEIQTRYMRNVQAPVAVVIHRVESADIDPELKELGIREVLGVGVSRFAGSPTNRIKNIKNGAAKLNGLLIPPGAEFSTISTTQPFTLDGGYLPELVIKGSKITPELGGGLCQIGTTLFRMAMNSAMEITERRNHSLVVSYYNDLQNGLPGTDATIYEPAPDFKFKNDTSHYVLIETNVNTQTGDLVFTLWGTSDGRKGYYDAPKVLRWIPAGPKQVIPSPDLAPGKENCQHAYTGAETTFTYHRVLADGTAQEKVFDSYYRPLPEICLVGAAASSTPATPETGATTPTDGGIASDEFVFPNQ